MPLTTQYLEAVLVMATPSKAGHEAAVKGTTTSTQNPINPYKI
jgi:hypothetical protein